MSSAIAFVHVFPWLSLPFCIYFCVFVSFFYMVVSMFLYVLVWLLYDFLMFVFLKLCFFNVLYGHSVMSRAVSLRIMRRMKAAAPCRR